MMYMLDRLKQNTDLEFLIPHDMAHDHFLGFSIRGFNTPNFVEEERILMEVSIIFNSVLCSLKDLYAEKYVFADPMLMFRPDSQEWAMKIGMMTKEKFEKMKEPALNP